MIYMDIIVRCSTSYYPFIYSKTKLFEFLHIKLIIMKINSNPVKSFFGRIINLLWEEILRSVSVVNFKTPINTDKDEDKIKLVNIDAEYYSLQVETAVEFCFSLLCNVKTGEIFNVCGGRPIRTDKLLTGRIIRFGKTLILKVLSLLLYENDISQICGSKEKLNELLNWISKGQSHV